MQQLLIALVITICPNSESCSDIIFDIYNTEQECELVIFEKRIFNGSCYEVESIIHQK